MNCRHASLLLLMAASALAQPSIKPPVVGAVRDSQGAIQTIVGVAGSFILADTGLPNAISAAFSSSAGLVKTDNELLVLNDNRDVVARFDAPSGPALLAFDCNGHPALVSYGDSLFQFRDGNLEPVNWTGDALSIASTAPDSAAILIRRVRQIWRVNISLPDGAVQSEARRG